MDKERINRIFAVSMMVLGILNILAGLFRDQLPHTLQILVAIGQVVTGCIVIYTSVLKIKGKF